ncbi:MAG TPA: polysaccharide deacetylase, partial [Alphaproteobacteria bacterium]|nr:polysaccharide deacetylase [Alphaproteobacteria bacterium]
RATGRQGVPLVLAVIPMLATPALADRLLEEEGVTVWQHGICHTNRAAVGDKKQELVTADRDTRQRLREACGRLQDLFGSTACPVLVPPWNRIAAQLIPHLSGAGFQGLSQYRPRRSPTAAPGLWQVNTHVDLVLWREERRFAGPASVCAAIAALLAARRQREVDITEPTGVLSHHAVMGENAWDFLSDLFALTKSHPAAHWLVPPSE